VVASTAMAAGLEEVNPYAPPVAQEVATGFTPGPVQTASRWHRLGGAIVDTLVLLLARWPVTALASRWG
jgi:hypothetical protein